MRAVHGVSTCQKFTNGKTNDLKINMNINTPTRRQRQTSNIKVSK